MKNVYQLISEVSSQLSQDGISKDRKNSQQGYSFRGIDDIYNALAPILARTGLVILPRALNRTFMEQPTKSGGVLFYTVVEMEFDFVSSHDGSKHTVKTYGEAMDTADKSTNKAMSAAYKYAAFQTFCIPTEGDNDADKTTHEVAPRTKKVITDDESLFTRSVAKIATMTADELRAASSKLALDASDKFTSDERTKLITLMQDRLAELKEEGKPF